MKLYGIVNRPTSKSINNKTYYKIRVYFMTFITTIGNFIRRIVYIRVEEKKHIGGLILDNAFLSFTNFWCLTTNHFKSFRG